MIDTLGGNISKQSIPSLGMWAETRQRSAADPTPLEIASSIASTVESSLYGNLPLPFPPLIPSFATNVISKTFEAQAAVLRRRSTAGCVDGQTPRTMLNPFSYPLKSLLL
jgi:hypothetical protein